MELNSFSKINMTPIIWTTAKYGRIWTRHVPVKTIHVALLFRILSPVLPLKAPFKWSLLLELPWTMLPYNGLFSHLWHHFPIAHPFACNFCYVLLKYQFKPLIFLDFLTCWYVSLNPLILLYAPLECQWCLALLYMPYAVNRFNVTC